MPWLHKTIRARFTSIPLQPGLKCHKETEDSGKASKTICLGSGSGSVGFGRGIGAGAGSAGGGGIARLSHGSAVRRRGVGGDSLGALHYMSKMQCKL